MSRHVPCGERGSGALELYFEDEPIPEVYDVITATRGSHAKYRQDNRTVIVPLHHELAAGTLTLRQQQIASTSGGA